MCPVVGCGGQGRFTGDRPVAELMGGNVVDSLPGRESRWAGTLLGPEGTAVDRVSGRGRSSVPGSGLETTSPTWSGWWPSFGLGFGGVFVNWIVDASI